MSLTYIAWNVFFHVSDRCQVCLSHGLGRGWEEDAVWRKISAGTSSAYLDVEEKWLPAGGRRGSSVHFWIKASFVTYGYTRSAPHRLSWHIGSYHNHYNRHIWPKTLLTGKWKTDTLKTQRSLEWLASGALAASMLAYTGMPISACANVSLNNSDV